MIAFLWNKQEQQFQMSRVWLLKEISSKIARILEQKRVFLAELLSNLYQAWGGGGGGSEARMTKLTAANQKPLIL